MFTNIENMLRKIKSLVLLCCEAQAMEQHRNITLFTKNES